jgi:ketosteroid isomerase-like protein
MSQENVEIVQQAFDAFGDGRMRDVIDALDEEVEMLGAVGGLEEGEVIRGREAVARQLLLPDSSVWAERRYEVQRFLEADNRVVALVHEHRRGRGSGIKVAAEIALIYSFRGNKVVRIEPYMSQSEALEAAGLRR